MKSNSKWDNGRGFKHFLVQKYTVDPLTIQIGLKSRYDSISKDMLSRQYDDLEYQPVLINYGTIKESWFILILKIKAKNKIKMEKT